MNKIAGCSLIASLVYASAFAQTPEVTLTRLDCSSPNPTPTDVARFSDTYAYEGKGKKVQLTASCYLIAHGVDYMIWDTGYPTAASGLAPAGAPTVKTPLVEQLAQLVERRGEQLSLAQLRVEQVEVRLDAREVQRQPVDVVAVQVRLDAREGQLVARQVQLDPREVQLVAGEVGLFPLEGRPDARQGERRQPVKGRLYARQGGRPQQLRRQPVEDLVEVSLGI